MSPSEIAYSLKRLLFLRSNYFVYVNVIRTNCTRHVVIVLSSLASLHCYSQLFSHNLLGWIEYALQNLSVSSMWSCVLFVTIIITILGKYAYLNAAYDFGNTILFAYCFLLYSRELGIFGCRESHIFYSWINPCFEWIGWMNDSMTHKSCRLLLAYQCNFQKECKYTDNKHSMSRTSKHGQAKWYKQ